VDECNALAKAHAGQASRFFDRVKFALAQGNLKRAQGPAKGWAYFNLATDQASLGHQEQGIARLEEAIKSNKAAIKIAEKSDIITVRARALAGFSDCLQMIWQRQGGAPDPQMVKAARTAHRLIMQGSDADAKDRALVTTNLAYVLSDLGQGQADSTLLDESLIRYEEAMGYYADWGGDGVFYAEDTKSEIALAHLRRGRLIKSMADLQAAAVGFQALSEETKDAQPYAWAIAQWNLADLALAKWQVSGDAKYLPQAQGHLDDARATFEQGLSEFQLNKCDELQGQIDAVRG
jgi:tetratricopeptide (TPR) repeat protein